jgi:hypothetical protein
MRIEDIDQDILRQMCVNHSFGKFKSDYNIIEVVGFRTSSNVNPDEFILFSCEFDGYRQSLSYPMSEYMDILSKRRDNKIKQLLEP